MRLSAFFSGRNRAPAGGICLVCGKREGTVRIDGGYVCGYCFPISNMFDRPTAREVSARHVRDPELIGRVDRFSDSEVVGDLHFDDGSRYFFKGPFPNYCIPILAYDEITGYRISFDGVPVVYNSLNGRRAVFKATTDEYIRSASRKVGRIVLEIDSGRNDVRFVPYEIMGPGNRTEDTKEGCFRAAISISCRLDRIIEENLLHK